MKTAVCHEVGRFDAEQVACTLIFIAKDPEIHHRSIVILLRVGERFSIERIVAPCPDGMPAPEDTVIDFDAVKKLLALVRIGASPRNDGNGLAGAALSGIDIAVFHQDIPYGMVDLIFIISPWAVLAPGIAVTVAKHDCIIIRVEDHPGCTDMVDALRETQSVTADAPDFHHLDITYEYMVVPVEACMIVARTDLVEIRQFDIAAVLGCQGTDVDPVAAALRIMAPVRIGGPWIGHSDDTRTGHLDRVGLTQRQRVHGHRGMSKSCPKAGT